MSVCICTKQAKESILEFWQSKKDPRKRQTRDCVMKQCCGPQTTPGSCLGVPSTPKKAGTFCPKNTKENTFISQDLPTPSSGSCVNLVLRRIRKRNKGRQEALTPGPFPADRTNSLPRHTQRTTGTTGTAGKQSQLSMLEPQAGELTESLTIKPQPHRQGGESCALVEGVRLYKYS